jgi:hypothetical protein
MTKLKRALCVVALAVLVSAACVTPALAAPRPVAAGNTPASGFQPAQNCNCHSMFIQEWSQSMHAKSLSDPLFRAKIAEANAASQGKLGPFCLKCHGPVGTMTGQLGNPDPKSAAQEGIPCSFCHQVTGASAPTNNVSLLVDPSGVYRAQVATPTAPHPTAVSPFHNTSEICGSCHNVAHPGNGLPVESTYTEWQGSPQAKAGVTCQDCHMSYMPGQTGPQVGWDAGGGPRRPVFEMNFMGAQVALGNPTTAEEMLKNAATLDMQAPAILEGADNTSVTVTITNVGAGHDLPTGLTEVRQMWLDVTFTAPDGKVTELGKHMYGTVLKNAGGQYPAQLWDATAVQSDDRIPPQGTSVNSYKFAFPDNAQYGTIKAQLLYRSEPDDLARSAQVDNPVTVMAESSQPVYASIAVERQANGAVLNEVSASPLTPLVISILGLLFCFAIVIFFVWWGRRPLHPGPNPVPNEPTDEEDGGASDESPVRTRTAEETPTVEMKPVGEAAPSTLVDETAATTQLDEPAPATLIDEPAAPTLIDEGDEGGSTASDEHEGA